MNFFVVVQKRQEAFIAIMIIGKIFETIFFPKKILISYVESYLESARFSNPKRNSNKIFLV